MSSAPDERTAALARAGIEHARTLRRAGNHLAAAAACHEILALAGPSFDAYLQLGVVHAELLEHAAAVEHLEKAIALEPANSDALCMLASVLHDLARHADCLSVCERAVRARAESPEAHFQLALARFELADFAGAADSFARCFTLRRREPWNGNAAARLDAQAGTAPASSDFELAVSQVKTSHDIEQMEYLLAEGLLPSDFARVLADYRSLHEELRAAEPRALCTFDTLRHPLVAATLKKPLYVDRSPAPGGDLLNRRTDWREAEERYLSADPSLTTVDDFLTPQALGAVRRFCRQSTVWNDIREGYLGAYLHDGFASETLLRVAAELRERLPKLLAGLPLQTLWGYKYDSALPGQGIGVHADSAAVNVNFWITEEAANLNPQSGGLLVYRENAPLDWGFTKYNSEPRKIMDHLQASGATARRVPYRENRAVIFDSDLFHATDAPVFRQGYLNRRINITLLYGLRTA